MTATATQTPILEARGLVKRYGHVTALAGSDFDLRPGEILAVIGDNGAGKSSLIKCLSGAVVPDEGEILLDGEPIQMRTPIDARAYGIETVYQTLAVSPVARHRGQPVPGPRAARARDPGQGLPQARPQRRCAPRPSSR